MMIPTIYYISLGFWVTILVIAVREHGARPSKAFTTLYLCGFSASVAIIVVAIAKKILAPWLSNNNLTISVSDMSAIGHDFGILIAHGVTMFMLLVTCLIVYNNKVHSLSA